MTNPIVNMSSQTSSSSSGTATPAPPAPIRFMTVQDVISSVSMEQIMTGTVSRSGGFIGIKQGRSLQHIRFSDLGLTGPAPPSHGDDQIKVSVINACYNVGAVGATGASNAALTWSSVSQRPTLTGWPKRGCTIQEAIAAVTANKREMMAANPAFPYRDVIVHTLEAIEGLSDQWTGTGAGRIQRMLWTLHQSIRHSSPVLLQEQWRREIFVASDLSSRDSIRRHLLNHVFWKRHLKNHTLQVNEVQSFRDNESDVDAMTAEAAENALQALSVSFPEQPATLIRALSVGFSSQGRQHGCDTVPALCEWIINSVRAHLDVIEGLNAQVTTLTTRNAASTARVEEMTVEITQLNARIAGLQTGLVEAGERLAAMESVPWYARFTTKLSDAARVIRSWLWSTT